MKKTYSSSFKGKIALEACIGTSTIAEIAGKYQVHPTQIQQWKKKLQSEVGIIFETNAERKARENKNYTEDSIPDCMAAENLNSVFSDNHVIPGVEFQVVERLFSAWQSFLPM